MPDETDLVRAGVEGVAKGTVDSLLEPVKQLTGEFCAEVGTAGGYIGKLIRLKTWLWTMRRAKQILAEAGIEPANVPPKLFLPIMEHASLEDDETLQEKWAALLANAANPNAKPGVHIAFAGILKDLSPEEADLLNCIHAHVRSEIVKRNLPWRAVSAPEIDLEEAMQGYGTIHVLDWSELVPMIENLNALGLVDIDVEYYLLGHKEAAFQSNRPHCCMTSLGFGFISACQPPGSAWKQ